MFGKKKLRKCVVLLLISICIKHISVQNKRSWGYGPLT